MSSNRRDVQLVIRARDEAKGALDAISKALEELGRAQEATAAKAGVASNSLGGLGAAALGLSEQLGGKTADAVRKVTSAYDFLSNKVNSTTADLNKQNAALADSKDQLDALAEQRKLAGNSAASNQLRYLATGDARYEASWQAAEAALNSIKIDMDEVTRSMASQEAQIKVTEKALDEYSKRAATAESALRELSAVSSGAAGPSAATAEAARMTAALDAQNKVIDKSKEKWEGSVAELERVKRTFEQTRFVSDSMREGLSKTLANMGTAEAAYANQLNENSTKAIAAYRAQRANLAQLKAEFMQARATAQALGRQMGQTQTPTVALKVAFEQAKLTLAESERVYNAAGASLTQLRERVRNNTKALNEMTEANSRAAEGTAELLRRPNDIPFGLSTSDFQNLSYQINDIVTQLGSGTSLMQTMAQQSGQILQIFPKTQEFIASSLFKAGIIPVAFVTAAALGTIISLIVRIREISANTRAVDSLLAGIGDSADYSAAGLLNVIDKIDRYRGSAAEARVVVAAFVREGLDESKIVQFANAAQDLAKVMGTDVAEAANEVHDAFTADFDAIAELDDKMNFLGATLRNRIFDLQQLGEVEKMRAEALEAFSDAMEDSANKMDGPWNRAIRNMGDAWRTFINLLAQTRPFAAAGALWKEFGSDLAVGWAAVDEYLKGNDNWEMAGYYRGTGQRMPDRPRFEMERDRDLPTDDSDPLIGRDGKFRPPPAEVEKEYLASLREEIEKLKGMSDERRVQLAVMKETQRLAKEGVNEATMAEGQRLAAEKERLEIAKERAAESARAAKDDATALQQTIRLLKEVVQLRTEAYQDAQGVWRVGYGSNTTTAKDGTVGRVDSDTTVTAEGALLDLSRRVEETFETIKTQLTAERWNKFSETQQAALASIALEYGGLPQRIVDAVRNGTVDEISAAVGMFASEEGRSDRFSREIDMLGTPNTAVDTDSAKTLLELQTKLAAEREKALKQEEEYLAALDERIRRAREEVSIQEAKTAGDEESVRHLTIQRAVQKEIEDAARKQITLDETRLALIKQAAEEAYDADAIEKQRKADEAAAKEAERTAEAARKKQQEARDAFDKRLEALKYEISLNEAKAIHDEDALRSAHVMKAVQDQINAAKEAGLELNYYELRAYGELVRANYDLLNAKRIRDEATARGENEVKNLQDQQEALIALQEAYANIGETEVVVTLEEQIRGLDEQILLAIEHAVQLWQSLGGEGAEAAIAKLEAVRLKTMQAGQSALLTGKQVNDMLASGMTNAIDEFMEAALTGENAWDSARKAFLKFAADFLRKIAIMIIQEAIFIALTGGPSGAGGTNGGGGGGAIAGLVNGMFQHTGGISGRDGVSKPVPAAYFANARRYHGGGLPGLKPNEIPTVLEKGEEVLTEDNPRHIFNQGQGGGAKLNLINVFDPDDVLNQALGGEAGEQTMINFVKRNAGAIKAVLK